MLEEMRLKELKAQERWKSKLPQSNDPVYDAQKKQLLRMAANFHFQLRLHTNICVNLHNKEKEPELTIKLEGIDLSLCNPVGPMNIKLSFLLRKFSIDTYYRNREMSLNALNRKKKSIFGGERGTVRGSKRAPGDDRDTIFDSGNIIERRKM